MIGAQTDATAQEHLIKKYTALPNQVWDGIISQATQVSSFQQLSFLSYRLLDWFLICDFARHIQGFVAEIISLDMMIFRKNLT